MKCVLVKVLSCHKRGHSVSDTHENSYLLHHYELDYLVLPEYYYPQSGDSSEVRRAD